MKRILLALALFGAASCGTEPETAEVPAELTLSPAGLASAWGFTPWCVFPGTGSDPKFFSAASVGGVLKVTGSAHNDRTFTIAEFLPNGGHGTVFGPNPGNVIVREPCESETFPASATVTYTAP